MYRCIPFALLLGSCVQGECAPVIKGKEVESSRYLEEYELYVQRSKDLWRERNPTSKNWLSSRQVNIISFPEKVCVSFEAMDTYSLGGSPPVYCYEPLTTKLIYRFDGGE